MHFPPPIFFLNRRWGVVRSWNLKHGISFSPVIKRLNVHCWSGHKVAFPFHCLVWVFMNRAWPIAWKPACNVRKRWCGHLPPSSLLLFMSMFLMPKRANCPGFQPLRGVRPYPPLQFRVKFMFAFHGKIEHVWMWLSMTQSSPSAHISQVVKFRCTWVLACSAWAPLWMLEKSTSLLRWPVGNFLKQMEITMKLPNLASLCTFVELHWLQEGSLCPQRMARSEPNLFATSTLKRRGRGSTMYLEEHPLTRAMVINTELKIGAKKINKPQNHWNRVEENKVPFLVSVQYV